MDRIALYEGKPLDDYTKDELIEIIHDLGRMIRQERKDTERIIDVLGNRHARSALAAS